MGGLEHDERAQPEHDRLLASLAEQARVWDPVEGFQALGWDGGRRFAAAVVATWQQAGHPVPSSWSEAQERAWRADLERVRERSLEDIAEATADDPDAEPFPERPEGTPYHAILISWLAGGCKAPMTEDDFRAIREIIARIPERELVSALRWAARPRRPVAAKRGAQPSARGRRGSHRTRTTTSRQRARSPGSRSGSEPEPPLTRRSDRGVAA